ncbi:MAG: hypothetical protein R3F39_13920 [Myxococcota bacterium]
MPSPKTDNALPVDLDHRCACGALIARLVEHGLEIKCRRCRRAVIVPIDALIDDAVRRRLAEEAAAAR